jgi:K+-transporting ATPase ATPase A chain
MTAAGIGQIVLYAIVLVALGVPLGAYMARVYTGEARLAQRVLGPLERLLYRLFGVEPDQEQSWKQYAVAALVFNVLGIVVVYLLQRLQASLPENPNSLPGVDPRVAFNTAVSFATNTNWQAYGGETTMSHLVQSAALGVQNFVSAATGMATLIPLIRGFTRKRAETVGNFWVDLTRSTLYILLPLSIVLAVALIQQGVPQTTAGKETAALLDPTGAGPRPAGGAVGAPTPSDSASRNAAQPGTPPADAKPGTVVPPVTEQPIAVGPVASQVAIKQLGTNGGGYYNVNSAHPLENPTPLSNFLEDIAILLIAGATCFMFGRMVNSRKQGVALIVTMAILLVPFVALTLYEEQQPNPAFSSLSDDHQPRDATRGGVNGPALPVHPPEGVMGKPPY